MAWPNSTIAGTRRCASGSTHRDFRAIHDFLSELNGPSNLRNFPDRLVESLHNLIPSDLTTYDEMDPDHHTSVDLGRPADMLTPEFRCDRWRSVMHEHPVLMRNRETGDLRAYSISQFYSQTDFQGRALYQEFYKKLGIGDVLCKGIRVSEATVIGCSVSRNRRSFKARDSLILDAIGPHLTQAWRSARLLTRLRRQNEATGAALQALGYGVVALSPSGRVRLMTPRARRILAEAFGRRPSSDSRLPEELAQWVRFCKLQFAAGHLPRPLEPYVIQSEDSEIAVTLLPEAFQDVLILEIRRPTGTPTHLQALGLTPREAGVLCWVAKGKTNKEIGSILETSPRTIQKHLERIFAKLGVETRTAAAAFALQPPNS